MALDFPKIDPVAFTFQVLGHNFEIHWYALAYVTGFILGWQLAIYLARRYAPGTRPNKDDMDDFITWAIIGVLLGGRVGYVLFYNLPMYLDQPLEALKLWHGGMSFHGGALGVICALIAYAKIKNISLFRLADIVTTVVPIGLFLGRVANFINGELYGRVTDASVGMIFPRGGELPRHPSQLYEAAFEGLILFLILFAMMHSNKIRNRPGTVAGAFLLLYGGFRFCIEFFREPDVQLGFIFEQVTMGQILCIPMMIAGLVVIGWARRCASLKT